MIYLPRNFLPFSAAPFENFMAEDTLAWFTPIQQNLHNLEVNLVEVHSSLSILQVQGSLLMLSHVIS